MTGIVPAKFPAFVLGKHGTAWDTLGQQVIENATKKTPHGTPWDGMGFVSGADGGT